MQTNYRPGDWFLIARRGALVALEPGTSDDVVAALWDRLDADPALAAVVDVLTRAGSSFASMPSFVAAVVEGADARVAVRGRVVARVTGAGDAAETISGAEVTTWTERFIAGATRIELTVQSTESGTALPVAEGIVLASAASRTLDGAEERVPGGTAAAPAPSVAPEAEPSPASPPASPAEAASAPEEPVLRPAPGFTDADTASAFIPVIPAAPVAPPAPLVAPTPPVDAPSAGAAPGAPDAPTEAIPEVPQPETDPEPVPADAPAGPADPQPEPEPVIGDTLMPTEGTFAPVADEFDHLWGATVHTPIEAAAVRPVAEEEGASADVAPSAIEGDHDGATISAGEARALRGAGSPVSPDAPTEVLSAVAPPPPAFAGSVRVSTGQVVALDRTVIIGRRPRSTRASGADLPHLIAVESPQQDISRNHLEIRPEGDTVVVIDLHTTNGSTLLRAGADPMRLHPGEHTLVLDGDAVDLGDGVTVTFEGLS
ncbi:FHA domain-containing protein [Microbacterium sp.]|uniref:FHA domain-containing protein n=1 Tax=Microbacterium sp. TaxID=51671 RepID=UPI00333F921C